MTNAADKSGVSLSFLNSFPETVPATKTFFGHAEGYRKVPRRRYFLRRRRHTGSEKEFEPHEFELKFEDGRKWNLCTG